MPADVSDKARAKVTAGLAELLFALEVERDRRKPHPEDRLLLENRYAIDAPRLYERMLALGRRASVLNGHPHRFRDTYAVDLLVRGASPYEVAKLLGDTVDTIEKSVEL